MLQFIEPHRVDIEKIDFVWKKKQKRYYAWLGQDKNNKKKWGEGRERELWEEIYGQTAKIKGCLRVHMEA